MPWREDYFTSLNREDASSDRFRVRLNVVRGKLSDFVVQYEIRDAGSDESYVAVVRYDGRHRRAHQDVLDREGHTVRKIWLPEHYSLDDALREAVRDIRENWRRYRNDFLRRR